VDTERRTGITADLLGRAAAHAVPLTYDAATDGFLCVCPSRENDFHTCDHRTQVNGSVGFVTSVFGMNAAGVVVRRIAHGR
jgi:tRNA A37 threonylcarbamoyladenosine dehydratase